MPVRNDTVVHISGSPPIGGNVVLVQGANVTLTQSGSNITVAAAAGGSGTFTITQTAVNFGTTPTWGTVFTITDGAVNATSKVIVVHSGNAATSKSEDENEMDYLLMNAAVSISGQFTLRAVAIPGPVVGTYTINYALG